MELLSTQILKTDGIALGPSPECRSNERGTQRRGRFPGQRLSPRPFVPSLIPQRLSAPGLDTEPVGARSLVQCPDLGPDPRSRLQAGKAFECFRLQAPA